MRNLLFSVVVLLAAAALGASRAKDNANGSPPTTCTDAPSGPWVSLTNATGCRMSVRTDAGHIAIQGKMVPYYCQKTSSSTTTNVMLPTESPPANHCTITARLDGGLATGFVCPDLEPLTQVGFVAATAYGMMNRDGGDQNFIVRMECWGKDMVP